MRSSHDSNPIGKPGGLSRRAFLRARLYMDAHIGEPMRLDDIAKAAHLSRSHFARAFRVSTGLSVMTYLRRLRIEKAKALLIERDISIADASAMLGFAHQSHFSRLFRREVGMAPRMFVHLYGAPEPHTKPAEDRTDSPARGKRKK
jgi:AraC family transcriptional regulator